MGMDVFGRNPSEPSGQYFRASIWMWRPLHEQIVLRCGDLFDEKELIAMVYNDGAGPSDQRICTVMADRFDQALSIHKDGFAIECDELRVTEDGRFVGSEALTENPALKTVSPYRVDRESVLEWIQFLRHCGGFEVW